MSFDEQPDDDPHGQCAAEISRLQDLLRQCRYYVDWFHPQNMDDETQQTTLLQSIDEAAPDEEPSAPMAES
jgi:hypothetical protein